ncbi:hypothetical protein [Caballeronia sp. KNU42]
MKIGLLTSVRITRERDQHYSATLKTFLADIGKLGSWHLRIDRQVKRSE